VAFVRFKGPYAYLVANARVGRGKNSRVGQKVICYLGRGPGLEAETVAKVAARFPDLTVDWDAVRRELAAGGRVRRVKSEAAGRPARAPARKTRTRDEEPAPPAGPGGGEDWSDWD